MVLVLLRSCVAIPMVTDNHRLPRPRIIIESECYMGMQMRIPAVESASGFRLNGFGPVPDAMSERRLARLLAAPC
jgi:hypothetical protein